MIYSKVSLSISLDVLTQEVALCEHFQFHRFQLYTHLFKALSKIYRHLSKTHQVKNVNSLKLFDND